jgi:NAD kinase
VEQWLFDEVKKAKETGSQHDITCDTLNIFNNKDEELKSKVNYIVTLGGDGTILYAAK